MCHFSSKWAPETTCSSTCKLHMCSSHVNGPDRSMSSVADLTRLLGSTNSRFTCHCCDQIYNDSRVSQLDGIPQFETHSTILGKMSKYQILRKDELAKFEGTLAPHQKAVMGDGLTIVERGVVEHNMIAVSKIYHSMYTSELALVLGVDATKAEKIAAAMIMDGTLPGSIDQVDGLVEFQSTDSAHTTWDKSISSFCIELNRVTDAIQAK